jgi:hypothetical protein
MAADRCSGCGTALPDDPNGPHHRYMTASSGCWQAFGEILAAEFSRPGWGREHRLTVDTYAAQHPGEDDRKQRQSVAIHLVALCHRLEHGLDPQALLAATQRLTADKREWPRLSAPRSFAMTVVDVLKATTGEEHLALVRRWAEATWEAWSNEHATVRGWADAALRAPGRA